MGIWHSALSWTLSFLTRRTRAMEHLEQVLANQGRMLEQQATQLLLLEELLLQQLTKQDLMESLRPVAAAMLRQDSLHSQQKSEITELLLEVLNSLQPSAEDQIFQRIGLPAPMNSSRGLES